MTVTHLPSLGLPHGATDTHLHVFEPARYPYAATRRYTPTAAELTELAEVHAALGIERCVIVQPSVYGTDLRCLLAALRARGTAGTRGIGVVDLATVDERAIGALHDSGIRGVRLNLKLAAGGLAADTQALLAQAAAVIVRSGWCVQVHGAAELIDLVADQLDRFHVPVVFDHFASLSPRVLLRRPRALDALVEMLRTGRVWVKLSAPYRLSAEPAFADLKPLAQTLLAAAPDRMLWGSDWPHTSGDGPRVSSPDTVEPFREVDLPLSLEALRQWCGDAATFQRVLVDNPAALYGFDA